MKKLIPAILILLIGAQISGAASLSDLLYMEERDDPQAIEYYDSIKYLSGKSERHYREAWLEVYNEDNYVNQCVTTIQNQAVCVGANAVVNLSWTLEHEYPDNWYTVVCQGLAVWKYSDSY
jgi:uncharacterized protein YbjQ (UPF0145 family)